MKPAGHEVAAVGGYRPEIDGLRMIAVLSVIFYHAGLPGFSGGYVGVDVFFVISGFLITAIIARELDAGRFSFVDFYERRARRILPALFAMCGVTLAAALVLLTPEQLRHYGQSQFATMAFIANIYFYFRSGYFTPDIHTIPLIHMWSLAVEEQFYLVFPVALLVIARFVPRARNPVVLLVFLVSLALSIRSETSWPLGNFYLVPFRAWELMAGGLVALYEPALSRIVARAPHGAQMLSVAGMVAMVVPIALYTDQTVFPGAHAIPVVIGTAAVIATTAEGGIVKRLLGFAPFVWVGLISYSAYLWHQPLFAMFEIWWQATPPLSAKIGLVALTILLAWGSLVVIERPFRDRRRISRRTVFLFAAAGTLSFAGIGITLHLANGLPQRYSPQVLAMAQTMEISPKREICHTEGTHYRRPANACRFFEGPTGWAVLGDSHGVEFSYALAERLRARHESVAQLTFSGCMPAYRLEVLDPGCSAWTRQAVAWLVGQSEIHDVIIAHRHLFYLYGDQLRTYPRVPDERPPILGDSSAETARALYWESYEAEVAALTKAGKRVWLMGPIPDLPAPVERYVFGSPDSRLSTAGIPVEWFVRRVVPTRDRIKTIAARYGALFVDPSSSLCDAGGCRWKKGNSSLYFDDNHLSMAGALKVVDEQMVPRIGYAGPTAPASR